MRKTLENIDQISLFCRFVSKLWVPCLTHSKSSEYMQLGAFSNSLSVKNLAVSRAFYEKLGFTVFAGEADKKYYILKNGNALIGLFEGMFEGNIMTFNPGWNENAEALKDFDDVRTIQQSLKAQGLSLMSEADEEATGPGRIILQDPDGNVIMLDQHV